MTGPAAAPRKPVILTVDDDPAVSRAVARDLRRHYGEKFRIVRAESGPDALKTLNELKLRGETVAVFVADYRMPQMSGIEFLEAAMDIFPMARRVLLTAYADTHAAIDAINVVDLDHYLLKPWDPPEEKLYPVIDALIEAWRATGERAIPHTKIIGHPWNARSSEVREFLARNRLYYSWFRSDEPKGIALLEAAGQDGLTLPVVVTEQGETLVDPTDAELAATLGLTTTPSGDFYDLVVIGGGPAGLAAAVYGASEGLKTVLIERTATGGQAGQSSRIENYLGFPDGLSGAQLAERARRQAEKFEAELITAAEVVALEVDGNARTVHLSDGRAIGTRAVILAMGVEYRQLTAEGCETLTGAGVYYGATTSVASECDDDEVYVIGGANSAGRRNRRHHPRHEGGGVQPVSVDLGAGALHPDALGDHRCRRNQFGRTGLHAQPAVRRSDRQRARPARAVRRRAGRRARGVEQRRPPRTGQRRVRHGRRHRYRSTNHRAGQRYRRFRR